MNATAQTTAARNLDIASTIADQIGRRAFVMLGIVNLTAVDNGLQFKVGKNAKKVTHVRVVLDGSDTYTVEFIRVGRAPLYDVTPLASVSLVYADDLRRVLETHTGMCTSL